jgi:hypothetical protein
MSEALPVVKVHQITDQDHQREDVDDDRVGRQLDFVHVQWKTSPTDASDCTNREASLAEVKRIRLLLHDYAEMAARLSCGKIRLQYFHHDRLFDIEDGAISVEDVDEEFCLSDVMKGCRIELTENDPKAGTGVSTVSFIEKHVRWNFDEGQWRSLYTYDPNDREPKKYWIVVIQDPKQTKTLQRKATSMDESTFTSTSTSTSTQETSSDEGYFYGNNVGYVEGCSCLEGNPCTEFNKYNCKDWGNRFAVALIHS